MRERAWGPHWRVGVFVGLLGALLLAYCLVVLLTLNW